jgi:hypothetical protein
MCVFVKVVQGLKVLIKSIDVDIEETTTFESLLNEVIDLEGLEIESLDKCNEEEAYCLAKTRALRGGR